MRKNKEKGGNMKAMLESLDTLRERERERAIL